MDDVFDAIKKFSGLDASLWTFALVLSVLLRVLRASFRGFDSPHTLGAAILLGLVGAILGLGVGHDWRFVGVQSITMGVVVIVVEIALRKAASKVSWIPSDDQWVKDKPEPPKP